MNITKVTLDKLYYRWFLDVCKDVKEEHRNRIRCAVSILEAYRSELMYEIAYRTHHEASRKEGFDEALWTVDMIASIKNVMAQDKARIVLLANRCPNLLIAVAGVINGVRSASNKRAAFNTILLLDIVTPANVHLLDELEEVNYKFITDSKAIYLPLREPEVYSVINVVDAHVAKRFVLKDRLETMYKKRARVIARVLGVSLDNKSMVA